MMCKRCARTGVNDVSGLYSPSDGVKKTGFYAVNAFIKPVVPMIFITRFRL